jgi:hypothetical protein
VADRVPSIFGAHRMPDPITTPCRTGKIGHPTPQAAHKTLTRQTGRSRHSNHRQTLPYAKGRAGVYKCPYCKLWHTGHAAKPTP